MAENESVWSVREPIFRIGFAPGDYGQMSVMLLAKRRSVDGEHIMRHFPKDDIVMRLVHHGQRRANVTEALSAAERSRAAPAPTVAAPDMPDSA